jgi:hypothetical protein
MLARFAGEGARLICVAFEQAREETLGRFAIPARLYKHIEHFAIVIHGTPQQLYVAFDFHENLTI